MALSQNGLSQNGALRKGPRTDKDRRPLPLVISKTKSPDSAHVYGQAARAALGRRAVHRSTMRIRLSWPSWRQSRVGCYAAPLMWSVYVPGPSLRGSAKVALWRALARGIRAQTDTPCDSTRPDSGFLQKSTFTRNRIWLTRPTDCDLYAKCVWETSCIFCGELTLHGWKGGPATHTVHDSVPLVAVWDTGTTYVRICFFTNVGRGELLCS